MNCIILPQMTVSLLLIKTNLIFSTTSKFNARLVDAAIQRRLQQLRYGHKRLWCKIDQKKKEDTE